MGKRSSVLPKMEQTSSMRLALTPGISASVPRRRRDRNSRCEKRLSRAEPAKSCGFVATQKARADGRDRFVKAKPAINVFGAIENIGLKSPCRWRNFITPEGSGIQPVGALRCQPRPILEAISCFRATGDLNLPGRNQTVMTSSAVSPADGSPRLPGFSFVEPPPGTPLIYECRCPSHCVSRVFAARIAVLPVHQGIPSRSKIPQ